MGSCHSCHFRVAPEEAVPSPGHPEVGSPGCPHSLGSLSPAADGGGTIAHWLDADYLFSSDAAHPDTRRWAQESLSYLEGKATVFHSCYLSVCASTRAAERPSVLLGHFILPPACLHEGSAEGPGQDGPMDTEGHGQDGSMDQDHFTEETESEAPTQGEFPCRALQEYPINNMVTGYASARDMKKYEGELHDFIPGTSGYAVYWVQSKCSIYCEKAKMKRKW
uniref:Telomere repeat binding bouquet formation protein 2 n=1 Tax=Junco hyemalis TaxID=40217 RepID=A0A8C5NRH1_JUNHY